MDGSSTILDSIFAVTVNWNKPDDTNECIDSLKSQTGITFKEIVVVDNGSNDDSRQKILHKHPDVRIIETHKNLGFAGGFNIGIKYSLQKNANFVLILNNDTICHAAMVEQLYKEGKERRAITGPIIFYHQEPQRIWSVGGTYLQYY